MIKNSVRSQQFPACWKDPIELLGPFGTELLSFDQDLDFERANLMDLVDQFGSHWVWDNRVRLAAMVRAIKEVPIEIV